MDYQTIIDKFYPQEDGLRRILLAHSRRVADKALAVCGRHPELGLDTAFVEAAAMLHDIGICECDAPGICCHGTRPYIQHGLAGEQMLLGLAGGVGVSDGQCDELRRLARVCRRHTGAGITRAEIAAQHLPLPLADGDDEPYMPETMEEQLVCYADKFFSKTRLDREKTLAQACASLEKFGTAGVERFRAWAGRFE